MRFLLTTIKSNDIESRLPLKYYSAILEGAPCEVQVKEFPETYTDRDIYEEIIFSDCDIVYFHVNIENETRINRVAEIFKKANPVVNIIYGGKEVSFDTVSYMNSHPWVDFVFRGEAERIIYEFVKTILTFEFDFESIKGLAYRENGEVVTNSFPDPVDPDDLPFPYENAELGSYDEVYYESFRGCPDRCYYAQVFPEGGIRTLPLKRVCAELRYFLIKHVKTVYFVDKWFNFNRERAYRIWEYLINNDNGVTNFVFDVNGDYLDETSIMLLSRARRGQFTFNIDIESTNPEPLYASGRKENIYQLLYNVTKLLQDGNVEVNVNLKLGLPCETPEGFARSFNKVYALGADKLNIDVLRIKRGTRLRIEADKYGYLYCSQPPYEVIANDYMPAVEMMKILRVIDTANIYSSENGFRKSFRSFLDEAARRPYDLFASLTEFIYANDFASKMDKKENLYRILYAYARNIYDDSADVLRLNAIKDDIYSDLSSEISGEALRKFDKQGWEITSTKRESKKKKF